MSNFQLFINRIIQACEDPNVGYSQDKRTTIKLGVDYRTYTDCSALISWGLTEASYFKTNPWFYTGNQERIMNSIGWKSYSPTIPWQKGDVLLVHNDSHQHTEVVYDGKNYITMGAHTDKKPFPEQVSIRNYSSSPSEWGVLLRAPNNIPAKWHAKEKGAYAQESQEAFDNAVMTLNFLSSTAGATVNAVSGLLGNVGIESGYNPWRWQSDIVQGASGKSGYGLFQFTPASKYIQNAQAQGYKDFNPHYAGHQGKPEDGNAQLEFIVKQADYYATSSYPESFSEFLKSTKSADYLASAWLYNYERPADPHATEQARRAAALYWYSVLNGITPIPPEKKGFPLWWLFAIK